MHSSIIIVTAIFAGAMVRNLHPSAKVMHPLTRPAGIPTINYPSRPWSLLHLNLAMRTRRRMLRSKLHDASYLRQL